nr:reverse transcriptase domain-containing protein [Tanacetum cinerariifolium]
MSAYLNDSRRQSYHSSRIDTESCYQSSRYRGTKPASEKHHNKRESSQRTKALSESEDSAGGHWKSRSKKQRSSIEDDDLSQPWRGSRRSPQDLSGSSKSGTLGNANMVPHVQLHTYRIRQAKKCIKDPVEIHYIKQRKGESTEDFVRRFMVKSRDVKGAPKIMRISRFMHGITNPELIKRLHDKIPKSGDV